MSLLIRLVISFKGPDQAGLGTEPTQYLKMIVDEGCSRLSLQFLINFVVARETEIHWSPQVVTEIYCVFLGDL